MCVCVCTQKESAQSSDSPLQTGAQSVVALWSAYENKKKKEIYGLEAHIKDSFELPIHTDLRLWGAVTHHAEATWNIYHKLALEYIE